MGTNYDAAAVQTVSQASNNFTIGLYQHLATEPGNLFFSPYSIELILALLYFGARGQTQKELSDALYLPDDENTIEAGFSSITNDLKGQTDITLDIASKIYVENDFPILNEFETTAGNLGSETEELDFVGESEESRNTINNWVEKVTNGKIEDLIPEGAINALTRMVLVNAIYFKGNWIFQFDKDLTTLVPFHSSCTETNDVETMHMENTLNYTYISELQTQAIRLPYKGERLSMIILLPRNINGLTNLEENLPQINFPDIMDQMKETDVTLYMPKFTMEWEKQLNEVLEQMGITSAFSANADFSGISNSSDQLQLSAVLHKAFIEVNEEGTEAAAATGGIISLTSAVGANERVVFKANHPFLFFILDEITKIILFSGRYSVTA